MKKFQVDIEVFDIQDYTPTVDVFEGLNGDNIASIYGWDVEEKMNGYNINEVNQFIECLINVRNYMAEQEIIQMYSVGDSIVNVNNMKTGNIVSIDEENKTMQVTYENGQVETVSSNNIKKLLLEVDPTSSNNTLSE